MSNNLHNLGNNIRSLGRKQMEQKIIFFNILFDMYFNGDFVMEYNTFSEEVILM